MPLCAEMVSISPSPQALPRNNILGSCRLCTKNTSSVLLAWRGERRKQVVLAARDALVGSSDGPSSDEHVKKRKVVEHISLLKAKADISDDEEKDMLDYLYTSQYQMRGILAISLGRIEDSSSENFTHGVYMRFEKKEDIAKFYSSPYYSKVLDEYVTPFSYASISVDFESEVEDDIIPIFRRGEDFNFGVEFMLLISVVDSASLEAIQDALTTLQKLIGQFSSFIVQATLGRTLNYTVSEYSHAAIIRFLSVEDFRLFKESMEFKDMWRLKLDAISKKALMIHFIVDPVGTQLM